MHQSDTPPLLKDIGDSEYPQKLERIIAKMLAKSNFRPALPIVGRCGQRVIAAGARSGRPSHSEADDDDEDDEDNDDDNEVIDQVEPDLAERIRNAAKPLTLGFIMLAGIALLSSQIINPAPRQKALEK